MVIQFFNQYSGISPIVVLAPLLIKQINEESENTIPLSPIAGSVILTACSLSGCFASFLTIKVFGRKTLLMYGQLFMGLILFIVGLCLVLDQNFFAFIAICIFTIVY